MSGASIDLDELERGTQAPSVVHEAVTRQTGQNDSSGSNLEGSASTTASREAVEDDIAPEHDVGQVGLARLKSKDPQFNFYPLFENERAMVLDSSVLEIHNLSRKMHRLRKSIKAKHGVEPRGLGRRQRGRKRWEMMSKKMRDKLKEFDAGFVTWKAIDECARPHPGALEMLHHWIEKQPDQQWGMYNVQDVDLFRLLGPERGPIERFVHEYVPATDLAESVLVSSQTYKRVQRIRS
ncbi:hypothetical protein N8I77_012182 [Diaporthe amygdali]|uniref:DUF6594 domain-containing protein n=1 Tax=Phomopsis amygdali TaxID=1214568 RepID=A0AAD9S562_PHOAM|nr:hypothetical protein N8I77_012182 [Diaporthe amygdali]